MDSQLLRCSDEFFELRLKLLGMKDRDFHPGRAERHQMSSKEKARNSTAN